MGTAKAIRRLGFRKWYERELLHGHANLVLLLLATVALLACAETYSRSLPVGEQLQLLGSAIASAAIGLLALRRYLYLLNHAEFVANQAVCEPCGTYARWEPVSDQADGRRLRVRCRHCGHLWDIEL